MAQNESGSEKTEKATPKKRRDARKEGQVMKSQEITSAFCAAAMFAFLLIAWPYAVENVMTMVKTFLSADILSNPPEVDASLGVALLKEGIKALAKLIWPLLLCAMFSGIIFNVLQVGFMFTTKPIQPKLSKISPIKGFKRLFSLQSVMNLVKSLIKVIALGYIAYSEYKTMIFDFPALMGVDGLSLVLVEVVRSALKIALKMCIVFAFVGILDLLYTWWKHEKDLMMTKQEIKDEYKNIEGDPQIKGKIRQKQREMSMMRMMEQVPGADVVITNPTHFAVALRYEEGKYGAPVVLAKGKDFIALKIKDKARENGIYIMENKPLAQSLYHMCEVGDEIPEELYQAVADVLVFVYRQKEGAGFKNRRRA